MKLAAFRAILVLALLALAVGQKSKSSRKSSRKSTTTTEAPKVKTTVAPPANRSPARGADPWFNRRGGSTGPGPSGSGTFPGPSASSGPGPYRNVGRFNGPGGYSGPSASSGRSRHQGRNNYQGPGTAPGAGNSQGASGLQGSGSSQGPNNAQGSGNSQGPNNAQGAGNTQGPNTSFGQRNPGRGRPGPPQYYLSWRHAPPGRRPLYTWQEAENLCRQEGRKLISVNTSDKQNYLAWLLDEDEIRSIWTAGKFKEGKFKWADNTEVNAGFTHWSMAGRRYQPQPDNSEGFEDCIAVHNEGAAGWHDEQCTYRKHFVCEF